MMKKEILNENYIEKIIEIFKRILKRNDFEYDIKDSIFSSKLKIEPFEMVYILMELSDEFCFELDTQFIDQLENYSFEELFNLVISKSNIHDN